MLACCFLVANGQQFVRLQQNRLVDSTGKSVKLNTVNLGGWLLWEGWIWGGGFTKESDFKARLQQLLGTTAYQQFLNDYYSRFITEKDIALIAQSGFNCIRLPFNYRLFDAANNGGINGYAIVDKLIQWCRKNSIYIVLDMHAAPGGQTPYFIADPSGTSLWKSEENKQQTLLLWKSIADKYKNETVIAGYDLLNEPDIKTTDLIDLYKKIVQSIRSIDTHHLLLIEGNKLAHTFKDFPESLDENGIYSFHYYPWFSEGKKAKALKDIVQEIPGNRPIWCGEWGEDTPQNVAEVKDLLNQTPNICGTAFWTWKRVYKNNGRLPLCSIYTGSNWEKITNWLTWKIIKPNKEVADKGVAEFMRAIVIENCTVNGNVRAAVVR